MATPAPPSESRSQTAKTKSKKRRAKKAAKKKMLIVPEGWFDYTPFGAPIGTTRIIPIKTPLKQVFNNGRRKIPGEEVDYRRGVPVEEEFTPTQLVDRLRGDGLTLGMVIDLTFTRRYYDPEEFRVLGVKHAKIMCPGREIPNDRVYAQLESALSEFLHNPANRDRLVAVHCTHGLNRTGYLVCRYLTEHCSYSAEDAIQAFNTARGYNIERENYLDHLRKGCPPLCSDVKLPRHPSTENPSTLHEHHPQQQGILPQATRRQKHDSGGEQLYRRRESSGPHPVQDIEGPSRKKLCSHETEHSPNGEGSHSSSRERKRGWSRPHPVLDIEGPSRKKPCLHGREHSPDGEGHYSSSRERERGWSRPHPVQDIEGPSRKRPLESRHSEVGSQRSEVDDIHKIRRCVYEGGHGSAAYDDSTSNDHYFYGRKESVDEPSWDSSYYGEEHYRASPRHARRPMAHHFGPSEGHSLRQPWEHSGEHWDQHRAQYAYRDSKHAYTRGPTSRGRWSQFDACSWYQKY